MNLSTSVFVYVGSIVLYKRIVNAHTQSIRIANADGLSFIYMSCKKHTKKAVPLEEGRELFSKKKFGGSSKTYRRAKKIPGTNNCCW